MLSLYDGDMNLVAIDDNGGLGNNALLTYNAAAGTYFIGVRAADGQQLGSYTVLLSQV